MAKHPESSDEQRIAFGAALKGACERAGFGSSPKLAKALADAGDPHDQTLCNRWFNGIAEPRRTVVTLLEQLTGSMPGELSRHLGWLPLDAGSFADAESAILADPGLDPRDANSLIITLRALKQQ